MKSILLTVCAYLAFLSFFPCIGEKCGGGEHTQEQSHVVAAMDDEQPDVCTPFCFDGCCLAHVICQPRHAIIIVDTSLLSSVETRYKSIVPALPYHSIWQPPKL